MAADRHTPVRPASGGPRTVAVANQKGGVAKTTTVASLGVAVAESGYRVLLVDLDPQACLTFSLGVDPEDLEVSAREVLLGECEVTDVVVAPEEGLHLLPSTIGLTQAEELLASRTGREHRLRKALEAVEDDYDWVFLDCPPSLGVLTVGALTAADEVLVPLQCETLAHRGVGQLLDTVYDVREYTNPQVRVLGVLPTMFDGRSKHAKAVLTTVGETYGLDVLGPPIPKTIRFAEAPALGRTILGTRRSHRGAQAYREVAARLLG